MIYYKGFNENLQCIVEGKIFQYEIGKTYEEPEAKLCKSGFHACENPLDVFKHYPPGTSRYCEVELYDISSEYRKDTKVVGRKIRIKKEIDLQEMISVGVNLYTGELDLSTISRDDSIVENSRDYSTAANSGDWSTAANSGDYSTAASSGADSTAANSGIGSTAANSGNWSTAANSGNWSTAASSGNWSTVANSGNYSTAAVTGKQSIAISTGYKGKAKANLGSWIILTQRDEYYNIIQVKAVKVDGEHIKPNVLYMLEDGEIVEVNE